MPEQYNVETDDGVGYEYEYDQLDRLIQIKNPEGEVTKRYVYNLNGEIIKEIDAKGYLMREDDESRIGTLYKYNKIGWLVEKREPILEGNDEVLYCLTGYHYDKNGNLLKEERYTEYQTKESSKGVRHVISYEYD